MRVAIMFPTYQREERANKLVQSIRGQQTEHNYDIYSFVDGCKYEVKDTICERLSHHGKQNYWKLYNNMIRRVGRKYDVYIYLGDDVTICDNFIDKAVSLFIDSGATALNILADERINKMNWTKFKPIDKGDYVQTQWVDMLMVFGSEFISKVGKCPPIPKTRWRNHPNKSSGVGEWISRTLHKMGHKIYCVKDTLLYHGSHESKMNPKERYMNNLNNLPIIAGMATFKGRERCLVEAYSSIINQVDELHIYANDDILVHDIIQNDSKVTIYRHPVGDLGDVGKFYFNQDRHAYYFSLDDDLIYPKDYISQSIKGLERYGNPITWHGRNLQPRPTSYYKGRHSKYRCLKDVYNDVYVQFPGTGVMVWRKDMITFDVSDFKEKNMADVFAGIKLNNNDVDIVCLNHRAKWIVHSKKLNMTKTIGSTSNGNREGNQIKWINELWQLK